MSGKFLVIDDVTGDSVRMSGVYRICKSSNVHYKSQVYLDKDTFLYSNVDAKELTRRLNGG